MRLSPLQIGFALAGLLILAGLIYAFVFHTSPQEERQVETAHSIVQVTPIHTDVYVQSGTSDFAIIPGQQAVTSGSVIKTSNTGRALIESASSHFTRLDYSSELTISEEQKETRVSLVSGAVWSRLAQVFDSGESYEVQTPNAIAAVRGTSFGVWYHGNTTILIVTEGSVLLTPIGDESKAVLVKADYKATRIGAGPVTIVALTKADLLLPWVVFNTDVATTPSSAGTTPQPSFVVSETPAPTGTPAPAPVQDLVRFSGVSPTTIVEGSGSLITLSGRNLDQVRTVSVDGVAVSFTIVSTTAVSINAPTSLSVGKHTVSISAPNGRTVSLSNALTVTARSAGANTY